MEREQRHRRTTAVALACVLLGLAVLSTLGVSRTRSAALAADHSVVLAQSYQRVAATIASEEALEEMYRLAPSPEIVDQHEQKVKEVEQALLEVERNGTAADCVIVIRLRAEHSDYVIAVTSLFATLDSAGPAAADEIDRGETDAAYQRISMSVKAASDDHARQAHDALKRLLQVEKVVLVTSAAGCAVGVALVFAFVLAAAGYTKLVRRHEADSRHHAMHDPLTGLSNREYLSGQVAEVLGTAGPAETTAVIIFDLDRFKEVNDTFGHAFGDELLRGIADRVLGIFRATDVVARLAGDEFAVLMPATSEDDAMTLAQRLFASTQHSFVVNGISVDVEASVGLAVAPAHGSTPDALMRSAETAMYAAKELKTGAARYRPEMNSESSHYLSLLGDLRRALEVDDQIVLYYQPKVTLKGGEVCGVEALVRWRHPQRGLISPAEFIPVAESTGLIHPLTLHTLRLAIAQAREWAETGLQLPVAVNLSARCLADVEFAGQVGALVRAADLPAELLRLEVTETAVMTKASTALTTLHHLRELGLQLSLDDFGTGFSSMTYLRRLPVDELKIDASFVAAVDVDRNDTALVRGSIDLGHSLGLHIVAEGVETAAQFAALAKLGCDIAQGFHLARPMPSDEVTAWVRRWQAALSHEASQVPEVTHRPPGQRF